MKHYLCAALSVITINLCVCLKAQTINTIAGNGTGAFSGDGGAATAASLYNPWRAVMDTAGNVYVADLSNHVVRKITVGGIITTVAGTNVAGFLGDGGPATSARLFAPASVALDASGNLYIGEGGNHRIRKVNTSGIISTFAGNGSGLYSGDGGPATAAGLLAPRISFDAAGNMLVADYIDYRIRKINTGGIITTIAGTGVAGFGGDGGPASAAQFDHPSSIYADAPGNIYISDNYNNRVRKISTTGIITTVVGNGTATFSGDGGAATAASLNSPEETIIDASGNIYIMDAQNAALRKVNTSGIISTIAGTGGISGFFGDGGSPTAAKLNYPTGVCINPTGDIYIVDQGNNRIRRICTVLTLPAISGSSTVCVADVTTLTSSTSGGTWSASNSHATVSAFGVVTGSTIGIDTLSYTLANACSTVVATKVITVNPLPNAGTITGTSSFVCVGSVITLADATTGGTWSSTLTSIASVSTGGIVTGVSAGVDSIKYSVTNSCGVAFASKVITVNTLPIAGTVTGTSSVVCVGSVITLTDATTGGTWSSSLTSIATVTTAGIVSGVSSGVDSIKYSVSNSCGTAVVGKAITVNPLPNAGSVTGTSSVVCVGSVITLADTTTGGMWSSSITSIATVTTAGVVSGVSAGADSIKYSVTNTCGTAVASKVITVNTLPIAGTITGASSLCIDSIIVLTDSIMGGTWSSLNSMVTITTAGAATGVTAGSDTIAYVVSNSCGSDTAKYVVTVTHCTGVSVPNVGNLMLGIIAFPNPNDGAFIINLPSASIEEIKIIVSNMIGTKVSELSALTNQPITVKLNVPAGIYLVSATISTGQYLAKIIVE